MTFSSSGWPDAIVGGAAAIVGAGFGAIMARRDTTETLKAASKLQTEKIEQEYSLTWEERELSRRQQAYVPLYEYVRQYQLIIATRLAITTRRQDSLSAIPDRLNVEKRDATIVAEERARFDAQGPTNAEQVLLEATPTIREDAYLQALVDVLGSQEVRADFVTLRTTRDEIQRILSRYEAALQDLPAPLGSDPSMEDVSDAAKQVFDVASVSIDLVKLPNLTEMFFRCSEEHLSASHAHLDRERLELERRRCEIGQAY